MSMKELQIQAFYWQSHFSSLHFKFCFIYFLCVRVCMCMCCGYVFMSVCVCARYVCMHMHVDVCIRMCMYCVLCACGCMCPCLHECVEVRSYRECLSSSLLQLVIWDSAHHWIWGLHWLASGLQVWLFCTGVPASTIYHAQLFQEGHGSNFRCLRSYSWQCTD